MRCSWKINNSSSSSTSSDLGPVVPIKKKKLLSRKRLYTENNKVDHIEENRGACNNFILNNIVVIPEFNPMKDSINELIVIIDYYASTHSWSD